MSNAEIFNTAEADKRIRVRLNNVDYYYRGDLDEQEDAAAEATERSHLGCISDINVEVRSGEIVVLCGASGSGKSTVIRTINGLATKFHNGELKGTVTVNGQDMATVELNDVCRLSATVFQNPRTQFFTTDVRSEMALPLENIGMDPQKIRQRIADVSAKTKLLWALDRQLSGLSGGQLQRVACACALCMDVPVILFDEPTSNLDVESIEEFAVLLRELKEAGAAIIVAEHRLHFLADLADTVHRLEAGKIVETFSGKEFFSLSSQECRERGLRARTLPNPQLPPPPMSAEGLLAENVRFSYGDTTILDIEKVAFPAGAITILSGPNGAGKTTFARVICGLAKPEPGAVFRLNGKTMSSSKRNHSCAIVMQDARRQLFAESVFEEVRLGQEKICDEETAKELLQRLDLEVCAQAHPLATSGGQQQRLVIAAALGSKRKVVIFDEPTSGVDYRQLNRIGTLLRELADSGAVVIVITHDREFMAECGDYEYALPKLPGVGGYQDSPHLVPPKQNRT